MNKCFYISNIQIEVESEIPLEEYEAEGHFLTPVLPIKETYHVTVRLVDEIVLPDREPDYRGNCRAWLSEELGEMRIFPLDTVDDETILTQRKGHDIVIGVKRKIWEIYMHSYRIWSYVFLEEMMLRNQALILHSASIIYRGKAILFTAPSETGKTTQTDIWHRNDASVTDLNGDRTVLQKTKEGWLACGIPISGTSTRCEQAAVPIGAIVTVNRAAHDSVSHLSALQKLKFLYGQVTVFAADENQAEESLALLEQLIQDVKMVQLNCTMEDSAYRVLLHEIQSEWERG